jgi:hypothetical protein
MAIVEPGKGRAVIEHHGASVRITIPAATQAFGVIFLGLWLTFWAATEVAEARQLLNGQFFLDAGTGHSFSRLIWFAAWTLAGVWFIYALLWQLIGKEIIELDATSLKQIKQILLFKRSREYAIANIANVRLAPPEPKFSHGRYVIQILSFRAGAIAFDYGRSTHRLGQGLDEADARHVIDEICKHATSLSANGSDSKQELEAS